MSGSAESAVPALPKLPGSALLTAYEIPRIGTVAFVSVEDSWGGIVIGLPLDTSASQSLPGYLAPGNGWTSESLSDTINGTLKTFNRRYRG